VRPKSTLHQFIRREHLASKVLGQEKSGNHNPGEQVAEYYLEKAEVSTECQRGRADNGKCAGLGGYNRESNGPPGRGLASKEVVTQRLLRFPEARAEPGDCNEIRGNNREVDITHETEDDTMQVVLG
jgi:hypothetical protein